MRLLSRVLPQTEWDRLKGTELEAIYPHLDPRRARVMVVENDRGEIVGCWSAFTIVHVEGVWIAPEHRKRGAVAARLLRLMKQITRAMGAKRVVTAAATEDVRNLVLRHLRGEQLPGDHFVFPVEDI